MTEFCVTTKLFILKESKASNMILLMSCVEFGKLISYPKFSVFHLQNVKSDIYLKKLKKMNDLKCKVACISCWH